MKIFTVPNVLTATRLIVSPLMLPVLLVYLLPYNSFVVNLFLAILFALLSLTDFFDGFIARRFNQESRLGKQLDPIADKFLSYSSLIALLAANKIFFYWVIILIGRDFFVMGVRALARENGFSIPVSFWGKLKTTVQMVFLTFVILNPYQSVGITNKWNVIETVLLGLVLILCVLSAKTYYDQFRKKFGPFGLSESDAGSSSNVDDRRWDREDFPGA